MTSPRRPSISSATVAFSRPRPKTSPAVKSLSLNLRSTDKEPSSSDKSTCYRLRIHRGPKKVPTNSTAQTCEGSDALMVVWAMYSAVQASARKSRQPVSVPRKTTRAAQPSTISSTSTPQAFHWQISWKACHSKPSPRAKKSSLHSTGPTALSCHIPLAGSASKS